MNKLRCIFQKEECFYSKSFRYTNSLWNIIIFKLSLICLESWILSLKFLQNLKFKNSCQLCSWFLARISKLFLSKYVSLFLNYSAKLSALLFLTLFHPPLWQVALVNARHRSRARAREFACVCACPPRR